MYTHMSRIHTCHVYTHVTYTHMSRIHTCHTYTHVTYTHMSHIHMELYFVFYFRLGALFFMVAIMGIINIPAIDTFMKERPIFV